MFVIEVPYFNLSQIYDSRQCPRWKKINNNKFVIVNDKKAVKVDQIKDKLIFNCSQEEFYEQWYNYLDLGRDYDKLNYSIKSRNGKFSFLADKGYGIHILNQNKFESFVYAGIVNMYGFKKAKKAIQHIVKYCGVYHESSMGNAGPAVWYEFPTPKMILDNFSKLEKMGRVNRWLYQICEFICCAEDNQERRLDIAIETECVCNDFLKALLHKDEPIAYDVTETIMKNYHFESVEDFYKVKAEGLDKSLLYFYILYHIKNPFKVVFRK